MNEYVLVEFLIEALFNEQNSIREKLNALGDDYVETSVTVDSEIDEDGVQTLWTRHTGKIHSGTAAILKLRDPFLAERMRISYISDDLKNKYRK